MSMSLNAVQQKFVAKCESKCQGGTTVARQLRKMFQQVDLDNDGLVNIREWAAVVESTNGAISTDEACALFEFWDTAGYARDPNGAVSVSEAIASLMSSEVQSEAVFDDRGRGAPPPSRGGESDGTPREQQGDREWNGNKGNRPSAPGGIFGGGVYESDVRNSQVDQQRASADRATALGQHERSPSTGPRATSPPSRAASSAARRPTTRPASASRRRTTPTAPRSTAASSARMRTPCAPTAASRARAASATPTPPPSPAVSSARLLAKGQYKDNTAP